MSLFHALKSKRPFGHFRNGYWNYTNIRFTNYVDATSPTGGYCRTGIPEGQWGYQVSLFTALKKRRTSYHGNWGTFAKLERMSFKGSSITFFCGDYSYGFHCYSDADLTDWIIT